MDAEKRDLIHNEILRLNIKNLANFPDWYGSLPPYARRVFDLLMEEDATPGLIEMAQQAPPDEWDQFTFLRAIGGGNPDPNITLALTNVVLGFILTDVEYPETDEPEE